MKKLSQLQQEKTALEKQHTIEQLFFVINGLVNSKNTLSQIRDEDCDNELYLSITINEQIINDLITDFQQQLKRIKQQ